MEIVPQAVEDARRNAELNGMENVEFFEGKAEEVLPEKYEKEGIQVFGVEIVPQAVEDARRNAELNGMENVEFFEGKAEEVLPEKYEKEGILADVIVVDPPRKGCDEACLNTMLKMEPERIVYVSCDSATLARDLKILCEDGRYQIEKVQPVDMFPHTAGVETVVKLVRKTLDA